MYFQSFGAVSIVKVNSSWFHLRERGMIGGAFGILISLGIYFAFDWGFKIATHLSAPWVCHIPAASLALFCLVAARLVRDQPSHAGHADFDVADASSGDHGPALSSGAVLRKMLSNPAIVTIMAIEWCSGFLRNAIMHWYRDFARGLGLKDGFVYGHWGLLLCIAGILGGVFAGVISDRVFHSRRGPVSAVLYGLMLCGGLLLLPALGAPWTVGWLVVFLSMCVIGVHGMLSGTASMDFGGRKNTGVAVGIIDGMVYFGTGVQSIVLGHLLPEKGTAQAALVENWRAWPLIMLPVMAVGLALSLRLWNARARAGGH
jgi:OPA family glycerol-3-phosphate transporter-like MFS transporter